VIEDHPELDVIEVQLGVGQGEPGEAGDMSDVDVDGHRAGV
jgi:hypothetical protein